MTKYVGCEHARPLLEGFVDGELSMADQLSVESHLRWCDTCALRVSDMRLIGASLRACSSGRPVDEPADASLTALNDALLVRVRAERAQSLPSRVREMFTDRHLLWPAAGATAAVLVCLAGAISVLRASSTLAPDSMAAMIAVLGSPGTELNPLRPAQNGVSIPRLQLDDATRAGGTLEQMTADDVIYAVRTVVGRNGSGTDWEVLLTDGRRGGGVARAAEEQAVLDAVRNARFVPAHTPLGRAVAVDMVLVFAKTTAEAPDPLRQRPAPVDRGRAPKPPAAPQPPSVPLSELPDGPRRSATA